MLPFSMPTYHHTAAYKGETFTRTSTTRRYTHALVGYRWLSNRRELVRDRDGVRQILRLEVDQAGGVSSDLELIGWAASLEAAERRSKAELGHGFARVEIIPATSNEQRPAQPRPWQVRAIALVAHTPDQYDPEPSRGLEMHYGRAVSYPTQEAAEERGRELVANGEADGYMIASRARRRGRIVLRGGLGDLLPAVRGYFDASDGTYLPPDGQPRRGESLEWVQRWHRAASLPDR